MATIKEDYVSFEVAKLLKEKGFDVPCNCYGAYSEVNLIYRLCITDKYTNWNKHTSKVIISCPTLQMAMKWLREVHHVACFICPSIEQGFHTNKWNSYIDKLSDNFPKDPLWFVETSDSYEQACESAIKYCLENLI